MTSRLLHICLITLLLILKPNSSTAFSLSILDEESEVPLISYDEVNDMYLFVFDINAPINWITPQKEFIHEGKLYDVNSIFYNEQSVTILCHFDFNETEVLKKNGTKSPFCQFIKLLSKEKYNYKPKPLNYDQNLWSYSNFSPVIDYLNQGYFDIFIPPPEC